MTGPGLRALAVLLVVVTALPAGAAAQPGGARCVPDRTDDQRLRGNADRPDMVQGVVLDGSTDLVEVCVAEDGSVRVVTAAPTGLDAGPDGGAPSAAWLDEASAITVGVDGDGDGLLDHAVVVGLGPDGSLAGTVIDRDAEATARCGVEVEDAVVSIDGGCLLSAASAGLQVSLVRHTDPTTEYAPLVVDVLPDGGGFVGPSGRVGAAEGTIRLAGPSRIDTAVAIAGAQLPDGAATVYLARADDLADAVAGVALTDGPVLLVPSCGPVPTVVAAAIDRLDPVEVVALGGPAVVCADLLAEAASGRREGRLFGADRFATAAEVAARAFPGGAEEVYLARGDDLADAVSAGSLRTGPVLLVPGGCGPVPEGVHLAVRRMLPSRVVALGGEAAVCEAVLEEVAAGGEGSRVLDTRRLAGPDRFATALTIAQHEHPGGAPTLFLARADDPADAVAGGVLTDGPTVLAPACGTVPSPTLEAVAAVRPDRIVALGGEQALCDDVLTQVTAALS